jgi:uncharacterized ferritin-like protein (DUF455 family)
MTHPTLGDAIHAALSTADPRAKLMATRAVARDWRLGRLDFAFPNEMPDRPARPEKPELLAPKLMPKRRKAGSERGRIALWHSIAHIEFVAMDLALDMAGRFGAEMGEGFTTDFLSVAADEALHFAIIDRHLGSMGAHYGDLPAHDGLWGTAHATRHDVGARLAIVPMVLEARGLDVTPAMLERVRQSGDETGARILTRILNDEIRHVRHGVIHFEQWCADRGESVESTWQSLVGQYFRGGVKPPFNDSARRSAGLSREMYEGIAV